MGRIAVLRRPIRNCGLLLRTEYRGLSVCLSHYSEPCKNGRTDRDAVWVVGLNGPKEACVIWGGGPDVLRDVAMATICCLYIWDARWRHLANTTEPSVCGSDAALCQISLTTWSY